MCFSSSWYPRTAPLFDLRKSEYQFFQESCWQVSDMNLAQVIRETRGWALWFVSYRVRDIADVCTYRRPWMSYGSTTRAGYKWSYDRRSRHLILMKSQTNLYYLTLKTNSLPSSRWNQTIAALSVSDAHQMCCVMISLKILVIALAMHQVFKYQQPILFLVNWCTVHLVHCG